MTRKEHSKESSQKPEKTLKIGFNLFTSTINIPEPVRDKDIFRALSFKPGHNKS